MITMDDILNITCDVIQVSKGNVLLPAKSINAKKEDIVFARQVSMTACRELNLGTLSKIGMFHYRSHCDVIHAIKTVANDIETDRNRRSIKMQIDERITDYIKKFGWVPERDYLDDMLDGE